MYRAIDLTEGSEEETFCWHAALPERDGLSKHGAHGTLLIKWGIFRISLGLSGLQEVRHLQDFSVVLKPSSTHALQSK